MTAQGTVFPAFIRAEYDGSTSAFAQFEGEVERSFGRATSTMRRFQANSEEVGQVLKRALASGNDLSLGRINVGVDQLRGLAAQAKLTEAALDQMFRSARELAASTGDTSASTRSYLAALEAQTVEARQSVAAANAQVASYQKLQSALDATADRNSRLAQSYREVFAEQARQAQQEVVARRAQSEINTLVAPGLQSSATDNGAGFRALEEQVERRRQLVARLNAEVQQMEGQFARAMAQESAEAERAAAAQRAHVAALDDLRRAEAGAAEGARLLAAISAQTGAGMQLSGKSARESAAAFEQYEQQLMGLKAAVDPAFYAQQMFDRELAFAKTALANADISSEQYQRRLQQLNATLVQNAASTRAQRFAYVQLGQQMQDVTIQAQMGVSPFTILVQQGSQAAFALTMVEGRVGTVARALAGPFGAAVFGSIAVLGYFITSLKSSEEAVKGLELASDGLSETQSVLGGMFDLVSGKLEKQNELLRLNAQLRALNLQAESAEASARVREMSEGTRASVGSMIGTGIAATYNQDIGQGLYKKSEEARKRVSSLLDGVLQGTVQADAALKQVSDADLKGLNITLREFREGVTDALSARLKGETAKAIEDSLSSGRLVESLRKPDTSKPKKDNSAAEAKKLVDFYERADERIQRINERFNEQPRLVDQVAQAMRELDAIMKDLADRKPPGFEKLIKEAERAKAVVQDALTRPFDDFVKASERQKEIDELILQRRDGQADALQRALVLADRMGTLTRDQLQAVLDTVQAERERGREIDKLREKQQAYLNAVNGVRSAISGGISGLITGKGGNFLENIEDQLADLFATRLTDRLFGGMFSALEDQITRGADDVRGSIDEVEEALQYLGVVITTRADEIAGKATAGAAANDNWEPERNPITDIVVTAKRIDPITAMGNVLERLFDKHFTELGKLFKGSAEAAGIGVLAGQIGLGSANSKIGSALGGIFGEKAGDALGKKVGGLLGDALGPLGAIAGGLLGGALGGIFNKTPMGSTIVTAVGQDPVIGGTGNTALVQSLTGMSQGLQQNLQKIADQFGAELGDFAVSFGQRGSYYRVAGTATTAVGNKHPSRTPGIELLYDGEDAETAMRLAILNALQDGAVKGIREGTKRLLQAGSDLDANLSKALKFEQVFKDLKRYTDPVGAALDEVNTKFRELNNIFKAAGASAAEFADLQDLYSRERADALKQVTEQLTSGLKSFLSQLTTGDSGLSLRARLANAQAEYDPLRARVAAGDSSAYDAYTQAAQTLLEIQRQIYGSGEEYFASLEQITALTRSAILNEEVKINAATGAGTPFDATPIVNATQTQTQALLAGLTPYLQSIAASSAATAASNNNDVYSRADYIRNYNF